MEAFHRCIFKEEAFVFFTHMPIFFSSGNLKVTKGRYIYRLVSGKGTQLKQKSSQFRLNNFII